MSGVAVNYIDHDGRMCEGIKLLCGLGMGDKALVAIVDVFYGAMMFGRDHFVEAVHRTSTEIAKEKRPDVVNVAIPDEIIAKEPDVIKPEEIVKSVADTGFNQSNLATVIDENKSNASDPEAITVIQEEGVPEDVGGNWLILKETNHEGPGLVVKVKTPKRVSKPRFPTPAVKPATMKMCTKCKIEKPVAEFHLINPRRPYLGYKEECKTCDVKAVKLAEDDEARDYLKLLSTLIPKGFPIGKPEKIKMDDIWNLAKIAEHAGGNEGAAARYMCRLSTWGYIGRKFVNRKRGYTFWITELGMKAVAKMEGIDAKSVAGGLCEAIEPNEAVTV